MKKIVTNFIPQNTAPVGAKKIVIFDSNNNEVYSIPLGNLHNNNLKNKLYSFGALSDVHLPYAAQQASSDFQKALTYFNNKAHVDFICISGDMSDTGTDAEWLDYKNHVDAYSPNTQVHISAGNHDASPGLTYDYPIEYTGNPLYYSFTQDDDVFIMFGMSAWSGTPFTKEALQWLYDILEENKDKRCFVFQHMMRLDGCGNAHGLYGWDGLNNKHGKVFLSLMEHYKNVIWFHGHSHTPFKLQGVQPTPIANYDRLFGCHSVHIPSLAIPRYGNSDVIFDAEGYVVDVYENGIHLRGIDFIEEEFVPIASYWIDTTPVEIAQGSYTDSLGVIDTGKAGTIVVESDKNYDIKLNQRYNSSGGGFVERLGTASINLEVEPNTNYRITYSSQNFIANHGYNMIYELDENMSNPTKLNGATNFYINQMPTGFATSSDKKMITIDFTTTNAAKYISVTLVVFEIDSNIPITDRDLDGAVLALENLSMDSSSVDLLDIYDVQLNKRWSSSSNAFVNSDGVIAFAVPFEDINDRTLKLVGFEPEGSKLSTWYAVRNGTVIGRIANTNDGTVWDSPSLVDNGDGTYSICVSKELFKTTGQVSITDTPDTIYISMYVQNTAVSSVANLSILMDNNLPVGSVVYLNQQYSQSGGGIIDRTGYYSIIMPVESSRTYTLVISNVVNLNKSDTTFYALDSNKANAQTINNSKYVYTMDGLTFTNDDKTSAELVFTTESDTQYVVFVSTSAVSIANNLKDIRLELIEKITIPEGSELILNQRYSQSGGGLIDGGGNFSLIMPIEHPTVNYTLTLSNMPSNGLTQPSTTLYKLNENKLSIGYVNNSQHPCNMTYNCLIGDDGRSAVINFVPGDGTRYMVFTFQVNNNNVIITENDLKDMIIKLDTTDLLVKEDITDSVVWNMNTRISGTDGSYKESANNAACNDISVRAGDVIRVYGFTERGLIYIAGFTENGDVHINQLETVDSSSTNYMSATIDPATRVITINIEQEIVSLRLCNKCTDSNGLKVTRNMEITVPQEISDITWRRNTRLSSSTGDYTACDGVVASSDITVLPGDVVRIYGFTSSSTACYVNEYKNEVFLRNNPLSNAGMNPSETNNLIAEFDEMNLVLTVQIKPTANITTIRVCGCYNVIESMRVSMNKDLNYTSNEAIVLPEGTQIYLNKRYSGSGNGLVDVTKGMFAAMIPVEGNVNYTLIVENLPKSILDTTDNTMYLTDESFIKIPVTICGSSYIPNMNGMDGAEFTNGGKSCTLNFNTTKTSKYVAVNVTTNSNNVKIDNMSELNGIRMTLVKNSVLSDIILPEGSELILNQRYSNSGGGLVNSTEPDLRMFATFIPLDHTATQRYKLSIKNSPIALVSASGSTIYALDVNKSNGTDVNGSNIPTMTEEEITLYNNNKSADIEFIVGPSRKYIALSLLVTSQTGYVITEEDLKGYEIYIEKMDYVFDPTSDPCDLTNSITWQENTRLSSSNGDYKTESGSYASSDIPCTIGDVVTLYNVNNATNTPGYNYVIGYTNDGTMKSFIDYRSATLATGYLDVLHVDSTTVRITILTSSITYIRVCSNRMSPSTVKVLLNM